MQGRNCPTEPVVSKPLSHYGENSRDCSWLQERTPTAPATDHRRCQCREGMQHEVLGSAHPLSWRQRKAPELDCHHWLTVAQGSEIIRSCVAFHLHRKSDLGMTSQPTFHGSPVTILVLVSSQYKQFQDKHAVLQRSVTVNEEEPQNTESSLFFSFGVIIYLQKVSKGECSVYYPRGHLWKSTQDSEKYVTFWVGNLTSGAFQLKLRTWNLEILTSKYKWNAAWPHLPPPLSSTLPRSCGAAADSGSLLTKAATLPFLSDMRAYRCMTKILQDKFN